MTKILRIFWASHAKLRKWWTWGKGQSGQFASCWIDGQFVHVCSASLPSGSFFFWSNFHISRRCNIDHFEIKPTIVRKVEGKCCGYGYTRLFPCHYLNWPGVPPSLRIPYLEVIWQSTQVFQSVKMGHLLYYFLCTGDWPTNHHFVWRNPREHHAASASQVMDWCVSAWIEESISIWHWK